jgi:hypothetical protein
MKTKYETWKIRDLLDALDGRRLSLPPYQRRGVWEEEKQKRLIASLKSNWPIGSLLFSNSDDDSDKGFLLIDGQQRVTAIRDYCKNPCRYLEATDVSAHVMVGICDFINTKLGTNQSAKVASTLTQWLRSCSLMEKDGGFSPSRLADLFHEELHVAADTKLTAACEDIVNDLSSNWDLSERQVPIVFFSGSSEVVAEIFRLINTAGAPLGTFDVIAATWFKEGTDTVINNPKIIAHIRTSYDQQRDDGMTFESPFDERPAMLVEYLFGLGKLLIERYPHFFGKPSLLNETDELGFKLAAVSHGLAFTKKSMERLNGVMKKRCSGASGIDPTHFEKAVIEACDFVAKAINDILLIRLNRASAQSPPEILHNTDQLLSIICRVLVGKYKPDFKGVRKEWAKEENVLRVTIRQFYLQDILEERWQGAAATRLFDRVWRSAGDEKHEPSAFYLNGYGKADWKTILAGYHEKAKMQRRTTGRYVTKVHRTFLKFAICSALKHTQQTGEAYEIEHLYPVSRLEKIIRTDKADKAGWAIDHVANLALFSRKLNREKSGETLAEYCDGLSPRQLKQLKKQGLNMLMCEVQDVALPKDKSKRFTRADYESFLDERFGKMSDEILECLFP